MPNLKPNRNFSLLLVSGAIFSLCSEIGAATQDIFWGSHLGSEYLDQLDTTPGTIQYLFGLDAGGTNKASLVNGSADTSGDFTGDLIELGFFDTDGVDDASYTPNTDTSNPFKGIWTPLTSKTTIGKDWAGSGADLVGAGEFYFKTKFTTVPSVVNESENNYGETLPRKTLKKVLPTHEKVKEQKLLKIFGKFMHKREIWSLSRKKILGGVFIGMFIACIPMQFQMVLIALLAILFNVNLPIGLVLAWLSNPFTMPFLYYFEYELGNIILNVENPIAFAHQHNDILQLKAQEKFGGLKTVQEFHEAATLIMGVALHLARGLGADQEAIAEHWIATAKSHGAKE